MSRSKTTPMPGITRYEYPRQGRGYLARYYAHDRVRQKREKNGAAFWVYDVSYTMQSRRRTRTFRVHLFPSQEAAFQAACAFREACERDMQRERQQTLQRQWRDG